MTVRGDSTVRGESTVRRDGWGSSAVAVANDRTDAAGGGGVGECPVDEARNGRARGASLPPSIGHLSGRSVRGVG